MLTSTVMRSASGHAERLEERISELEAELDRTRSVESFLIQVMANLGTVTDLTELAGRIRHQLGSLIDTRNFYIALFDAERRVYSFPYYVDEVDQDDDWCPQSLVGSLTDYVRRTGRPALVDAEAHRRLKDEGEVSLVGTDSAVWLGAPLILDADTIGVVCVQSYRDESLYTSRDLDLLNSVAGSISVALERTRSAAYKHQAEEHVQQVQRIESLRVMAGGIAHDFNNLLTVILGRAEMASRFVAGRGELGDHLEQIRTTALAAAELSNQMLAFTGNAAIVSVPVDINQIVGEMVHLAGMSSSSIDWSLNLLAERLLVSGDRTQLSQVVMNLLSNAVEAIGSQGGTISVSTSLRDSDSQELNSTLVDGDVPKGTCVVLEVGDTGCGMDRETVKRVFDPFFSTKFTGRGMGMASVFGIVRAHHGAAAVDSDVGAGTTVKVFLPVLSTQQIVAVPETTTGGETWCGTGKVLVVDDQEDIRLVASHFLKHLGFEVVTAASGAEALAVFEADPSAFDLVLLDLMMPGMSGERVLSQIRAMQPEAKVIISSGFSGGEVSQRLDTQNVNGILPKPYELSDLSAEIRRVFED